MTSSTSGKIRIDTIDKKQHSDVCRLPAAVLQGICNTGCTLFKNATNMPHSVSWQGSGTGGDAYASICQSARVWVCVSKLMPVFTTGRPLRAKREG